MTYRVLGFLLLGAAIIWLEIPATNAQQETPSLSDTKMRNLIIGKRDVLQQRLDYLTASYKRGDEPYDSVLQAHELLLQAELELATTRESRLEIFTRRVENYQRMEDWLTRRFELGQTTADRRLLATAQRMQAEIDRIREELKAN